MDDYLQGIIEKVERQFMLDDYFLKRYTIFHEKKAGNRFFYTLSMEWFPSDVRYEESDEDLNPDGTVIIEIDFHSHALYRLVFVGKVSHPQANLLFPGPNKLEVIDWVEEITDLTFGKQFKIAGEESNEFRFSAAIDHIPTVPIGTIDVTFNSEDELTAFSIDGLFPTEDEVVWEPYSLTVENLNHIFKQQLKLIEIPIEEEKKWLPIYGIDELYVRNQGGQVIEHPTSQKARIDLLLEWASPLEKVFNNQIEIDLSTEVTLEQAKKNTPHPDNQPLTEAEKQTVIENVKSFMQQEYPHDSGKWTLVTVSRDHGYILSELRLAKGSARIFPRKVTIFLDRHSFKVHNYIDNKMMHDMFAGYKEAEGDVISSAEAFDKLESHMKVIPTYVYHPEENLYYLYGKVDSDYGVIAATGEVVHLDGL